MTKQAPSLSLLLGEFESAVRLDETAGILPLANARKARAAYEAAKAKCLAVIEALEGWDKGPGRDEAQVADLRDTFAGQAVMPLTIILTRNGTALDTAQVAKQAYAMADAMLTARAS